MPPISLWLFNRHLQPGPSECLTRLSNCPLDSWVDISVTSHTQHADRKLGPHSTLIPIPLPCCLFIPLFAQVLRPQSLGANLPCSYPGSWPHLQSFFPLLIWFAPTGLFTKFIPIRRPLHMLYHLHRTFFPQIFACSPFSGASPIQSATLSSLSTTYPALYSSQHHPYLSICLFIYCLCLSVFFISSISFTMAGSFFFSTCKPLALRTVPGT